MNKMSSKGKQSSIKILSVMAVALFALGFTVIPDGSDAANKGTLGGVDWQYDGYDTVTLTVNEGKDGSLPGFMLSPKTSWWNELGSFIFVLNVEDGVLTIADSSFMGIKGSGRMSNQGLQEVNFPDSLGQIGSSAFFGCLLTNVTIPANVELIGQAAFCQNPLETVTVMATKPPVVYDDSFLYEDKDGNLAKPKAIYVPAESLELYKASKWGYYIDVLQPIPEKTDDTVSWKWVNYDGTVLQTNIAPKGELVVFDNTSGNPVHKDGLTFCGWSSVEDDDGNVTMTAMFQEGPLDNIGGDDGTDDSSFLSSIIKELRPWLEAAKVFFQKLFGFWAISAM